MPCPGQQQQQHFYHGHRESPGAAKPQETKPDTNLLHPSFPNLPKPLQKSLQNSPKPPQDPQNPLRLWAHPKSRVFPPNSRCFPQIQGVSPPKKPSCARQTQQNQQHQVCCDKARGTCCKQGGLEEKLTQFPISIGTSGKPSFVHLHEVESLAFSSGLG